MNNFKAAILSLMAGTKPIYYPDSRSPRARNNDRKASGKTKRGASHKVGSVFLGRRKSSLTPAQWRHLQSANPERAAYEEAKENKRKWISA